MLKALVRRVTSRKPAPEHAARLPGYPDGHPHSPVPSEEDIRTHFESRKHPGWELPGIELSPDRQRELLLEYARYYKDLPFPEQPTAGHRYYYENDWFSYSDAIYLYGFLRKFQPKRIIEVGSGFSSAVMLDTVDGFFPSKPEMIFIEPNPGRLESLLREGDREHVSIIESQVQAVPLELFPRLESGDLLFIDSSHVVKCGSDLELLMFEVLPRLQPGVFVHFHDIFYPFDYPLEWLAEGRYWNEAYFLRAFLAYNSEWSIRFFNTCVQFMFADLIREKMPLCVRNPGGSIYIQRGRAGP